MANKIAMPSREEMEKHFAKVINECGDEELRQLPKATGWRLLVMMPPIKETTAGGIILADDYVKQEQIASPIGYVVDKGPLCYMDKKKFPDGAHWCNVGDFIVFRPYAGSRLIIHGYEFRFITDEAVDGIVADPRGIERI